MGRGKMEHVTRIYIHKVAVDIVDPEHLPQILANLIDKKENANIVFIHSWDVIKAHRSPATLAMLNNAALVLPVSRMVAAMASFLHCPVPVCYYPFDTIIRILAWVESRGGSLFFLGGNKREVLVIEQNLRTTFPKLRFLGRFSGFFSRNVGRSVTMAVGKADPGILLVGTGLRKYWLYYRRALLNKGIMIWNEEWFNFVLQKRRRPVKTVIARGHEWIYELYAYPFKVFRIPIILVFWLKLLFVRLLR